MNKYCKIVRFDFIEYYRNNIIKNIGYVILMMILVKYMI